MNAGIQIQLRWPAAFSVAILLTLAVGCTPGGGAAPSTKSSLEASATAAAVSTETVLAFAKEIEKLQTRGISEASRSKQELARLDSMASTMSVAGPEAALALEDLKLALKYAAAAVEARDAETVDVEAGMAGTTAEEWARTHPGLPISLPSGEAFYGDIVDECQYAGMKPIVSAMKRLGAPAEMLPGAPDPPLVRPDTKSALRNDLMDAARAGLKTSSQFVVHQLYVQSDYAIGDLENVSGGTRRIVAFNRQNGVWKVVWSGPAGKDNEEALAAAVPGISESGGLIALSWKRREGPSDAQLRPILKPVAARLSRVVKLPLKLNASHAYTSGSWAFVIVNAANPDGTDIDWSTTRWKQAMRDDELSDAGNVVALLRRKGGVWEIVNYDHGPFDVSWFGWRDEGAAPANVFP